MDGEEVKRNKNMRNFGIRYTKGGLPYCGWIPVNMSIDEYIQLDKLDKIYGRGYHEFVPKDYI